MPKVTVQHADKGFLSLKPVKGLGSLRKEGRNVERRGGDSGIHCAGLWSLILVLSADGWRLLRARIPTQAPARSERMLTNRYGKPRFLT